MYIHNLHQAVKEIVVMAMWFERARAFAASGWEPRCTLPLQNGKWDGNSAGRFRDAWDAGWTKGVREREGGLQRGHVPNTVALSEWLAPWRIGEWIER
jgi:hypothetical protein